MPIDIDALVKSDGFKALPSDAERGSYLRQAFEANATERQQLSLQTPRVPGEVSRTQPPETQLFPDIGTGPKAGAAVSLDGREVIARPSESFALARGGGGQVMDMGESGGAITRAPSMPERLLEQGVRIGVPTAAALLTEGTSIPIQMLGQLGGTALLQTLGLERPGLMPYAETAATDLGGRLLFGAGRELTRNVLEKTRAGKLFRANDLKGTLAADRAMAIDALEATKEGTEQAVSQAIGEGRQVATGLQSQADQAIGEGIQAQAGRTGALSQFTQTVEGDLATVDALKARAAQGTGLLQDKLTALGDETKRQKALVQSRLSGLRQQGAIDASQWLKTLPVPDDATVTQLYNAVDQFNGSRVPTSIVDALDATRLNIAAKEARIASLVPEASNPALRRLGKPGTQAAVAVPEEGVLEQVVPKAPTQSLTRTSSHELELQDFLRQPDKQGKYGVKLTDDELFGEFDALLGKAESGSSRLKNTNGFTTDAMAQRAHEQGFIDTPDKESLLRALDESIFGGKPVYSKFKTPPDFAYTGITAGTPESAPTFQAVRATLTRLGQKIGDSRRAVNMGATGASEELAAYSSLYGALQTSLEKAATAEGGELTAAAREALKQANAAFKVQATVEDLRGLIEAKMRTPEGSAPIFNPGAVLDALHRPQNKSLRDNLEGIGVLGGLESFLNGLQTKLAEPRQALAKARELETTARLLSRDLRQTGTQIVERYGEAEAAMRQRLAAAKAGIGEETAAIGQQADARAAMLQNQAGQVEQQAQAQAEMLKAQGQRQVAQQEGAIGEIDRRIGAIQTPSASIIPGQTVPAIAGLATQALTGDAMLATKVALAAESIPLLARYLMTPSGQKLVGNVLESSGGLVTPDALIVLLQSSKQFAPLATEAVKPFLPRRSER